MDDLLCGQVLDKLYALMCRTLTPEMMKELLWTLSNIVCHSHAAVKTFIQHEIFQKSCEYLESAYFNLRIEANLIVSNVFSTCSVVEAITVITQIVPNILELHFKGLE